MSHSIRLLSYIGGTIAVGLMLWALGADERLLRERTGAVFGLILLWPVILWWYALVARWRGKE